MMFFFQCFHQKMNGPLSCNRAIRYSGLLWSFQGPFSGSCWRFLGVFFGYDLGVKFENTLTLFIQY